MIKINLIHGSNGYRRCVVSASSNLVLRMESEFDNAIELI